jgi:hypothetical protein
MASGDLAADMVAVVLVARNGKTTGKTRIKTLETRR